MANLIPSNVIALVGQDGEFESTLNSALWTLTNSIGTLAAGSTTYKKLFTAASVGTATLSARKLPSWEDYNSTLTLNANATLTVNSNNSNFGCTPAGTITNIGDSATWEMVPNNGGFRYVYTYNNSTYTNIISFNSDAIIFYRTDGATQIGTTISYVLSDKLLFELVDNGAGAKALKLSRLRSGVSTLVGTSTETYTNLRLTPSLGNAMPIGTVIQPFYFYTDTQETATIEVVAAVSANFTFNQTFYNLGENVVATDTTTGGLGAKTYQWKLNGSNYSTLQNPPAFTGLSAGEHTISLTVTDDSGTQPLSKKVYIGSITGAAIVQKNTTSNYSSNITSSKWSVNSIDPNKSTINSSGIFSANKAETVTLTAQAELWSYLGAGGSASNSDNTVTYGSSTTFDELYADIWLKNAGDFVSIPYFATTHPEYTKFRIHAALYDWIEVFGNGFVVDTTGATIGSYAPVVGKIIRIQKTINGYAFYYDNNFVAEATATPVSGSNFDATKGSFFKIQVYALAAGTVIPKPVFSSSTFPQKLATKQISVYEPLAINNNATLPSGRVGENYAVNFDAVGGIGAKTLNLIAGAFPAGTSLFGTTLSGVLAAAADYSFTLRLSDSLSYVDKAFAQKTLPIAPVIAARSPLPYAQIGKPYSYQFAATGGSGSGAFSVTLGNLPANSLNAAGALSIPAVGASNYTFILRYTDAVTGDFVEKAFTVPVSPYAAIAFCHKRPLPVKEILKQRIFEPIEGDDEVAEDAAPQYEYTMNTLYIGGIERETLRQFLYDHRKRQKFLWVNPDRNNEALLVKRVSSYEANEMLNYGNFEFTIRTV